MDRGEVLDSSAVVVVNLNPAIDRVLHVSSWRPGDTVRVERAACYAGGKGTNVGRALKRLGLPVKTVNLLSGRTGQLWANLLADEGIEGEHIEVPGSQTRINVTVCVQEDASQETHFIDAGPQVPEDVWEKAKRGVEASLAFARCLVLTGSLPPGLPTGAYGDLAELSGEVPVCLDTSGPPLESAVEKGPWMVKPNKAEAESLFHRVLDTKDDLRWAVRRLWELGVRVAAISLGEEGAVLGWKGELWWGKISVDRLVSTVGCGDAFLAGLISAALQDASTEEVLLQALAAGAASAIREGPGDIGPPDSLEEARGMPRVLERWE